MGWSFTAAGRHATAHGFADAGTADALAEAPGAGALDAADAECESASTFRRGSLVPAAHETKIRDAAIRASDITLPRLMRFSFALFVEVLRTLHGFAANFARGEKSATALPPSTEMSCMHRIKRAIDVARVTVVPKMSAAS